MRFFIASAFILACSANAQMMIEQMSRDGKKANIRLDNAKNYKVGDSVLFYKNRKLVSKGTITYLTPKKTKAAVVLSHGAPFQTGLVGYDRFLSQIEGRPQRQVAQKKEITERVERSPASISNMRMSLPTSLVNSSTRDLLYYPEEKTFLLNFEGHYASQTIKLDNLSDSKFTSSGITPTLYYSPLSNLAFGFGIGYESETQESGGTSDTGSGITDPSLHFSYQFMSEKEDGMQLVLLSEFSPSIGDSTDSNVLRGNHLVRVGTLLGFRHKMFSWSLVPNLKYYTETKTEGGANDMKSYLEFAVEAEAQYDLSQRWAIYAPLLLSYTGEQKAKDDSYKIKSYFSAGMGLGFKYAVSEALNVYFDGRYQLSPSVTFETSTPSTHDGDGSGFIINLGTNYKF